MNMKLKIIILLYLFLPIVLWCEHVSVLASIEEEHGHMIGKIIVEHDDKLVVDESSFIMDGNFLETELLHESSQSSVSIINGHRTEKHIIISTYCFEIENETKGVYTLSPIGVRVGNKIYYSQKVIYEVHESISSSDFILESFIQGDSACYPGQQLRFIYRIKSKSDIEITYQEMPLLEAKGMKRIGEADIKHYREKEYYVQEIAQDVEGINPGTFVFGPSILEGYAYATNFFGQRHYKKNKICAKSPPVIVSIKPFPENGKPSSFNGAVGDFVFDVSMLTSNTINVGDKIQLKITIRGTGNLEEVRLPTISQQEGFYQFRFSDIPPVGYIEGNEKKFLLDIRPLSASIREIPNIAFSFFNPLSQQYKVLYSQPIPINVISLKEPKQKINHIEENKKLSQNSSWRELLTDLRAIEISGNFVLTEPYTYHLSSKGKIFYFVPLCFFILSLQIFIKRLLLSKKSIKCEDSLELYKKALHHKNNASIFCHLLEKALLLGLYENGFLSTRIHSYASLPNEGLCGRIKNFLSSIEEKRFSEENDFNPKLIINEVHSLYSAITENMENSYD